MFYSKELLSKKTPIGLAWYAAHNKLANNKLGRGRIMGVNVGETCNQIMFPAAPHSLRTSSILANGVVIIHYKQSAFLLHDCEDALRHLAALAKIQETEVDGQVAKEGDITLKERVDVLDATSLFPIFYPAPSLAPLADDAFIMPSVPDGLAERKALGAPTSSRQDLQDGQELFTMMDQMEIMEAPELPAADFEMMMGDMMGFDAGFMEPAAPEERQPSVTPQPVPENAVRRALAKRRRKKVQVDSLDAILISSEDFRRQLSDDGRAILTAPRPQHGAPKFVASLEQVGPATGPWPAELMAVWANSFQMGGRRHAERRGDGSDQEGLVPKRPVRVTGADIGVPAESRKRALDRDRLVHPDEPLGNDTVAPAPADEYYGYGGFDFMADPDDGAHGGGDDPFQGVAQRRAAAASLAGSEGLDLETERLRAALNGAPGSDYRDIAFQLGLTPASGSDRRLSTGRRGRSSAGLRRDSEGGRLSEKSSDRWRDAPRLSDMLDELQAGDGDLGAALPVVGEDQPYLGAELPASGGGHKRTRLDYEQPSAAGLSQFQLVEESGPTMPSAPTLSPGDDLQTLHVLSMMKPMMEKLGGSLFGITADLSRLEAAKTFAHMLVAYSKGYICLEQEVSYGDVRITFTI